MASWLAAFCVAVCLFVSRAASQSDLCEDEGFKCPGLKLLDASEDGFVKLSTKAPSYVLVAEGESLNSLLDAVNKYLSERKVDGEVLPPPLPVVLEYTYESGKLEFANRVIIDLGSSPPQNPSDERLYIREQTEALTMYTKELFNGEHDEDELLENTRGLLNALPSGEEADYDAETIYYAVFNSPDKIYESSNRAVSVRITKSD